MALGLGEQVGYSNLVESLLGTASTRARASPTGRGGRSTSARSTMRSATSPISPTLFPKMLERLRKTGRGAWLDEEMERLADPAITINDPNARLEAGQDPSRKPDALGRLKALAAWRELEARGKNLPRGRIIKDETLADIAMHPPSSQDALGNVRGLSADLEGQRYRRADDGGPQHGRAPAPLTSCRRATSAGLGWGKEGAGRGPAEAAAQDQLAGKQCRAAAGRQGGGARGARRRPPRGPRHPAGLALRGIRPRRARPGRRPPRLRDHRRQAQHDAD
jgi:ribonuclease D